MSTHRDDASAQHLIAGAQSWETRMSSNNEGRHRSMAFVTAYQERLEELRRIRVPCLAVGFELDADTFVARAREVAAAIPRFRYVELAGAGHLTPVVDPETVIDPVLAFLTEVDQRGVGQPLHH